MLSREELRSIRASLDEALMNGGASAGLAQYFVSPSRFFSSLYVATPSFATRIANAVAEGEPLKQKDIAALTKYATRMGSRCTPFGAFVEVEAGTISGEKAMASATSESRCQLSLDGSVLYWLASHFEEKIKAADDCVLQLNPTFIGNADAFQYIERVRSSSGFFFRFSAAEGSDALRRLSTMSEPSVQRAHLRTLLNGQDEYDAADIDSFIDELIEVDILRTTLEPPTVGNAQDALDSLLSSISLIDATDQMVRELRVILSLMNECSTYDLPNRIEAIERSLEAIGVPFISGKAVVVDQIAVNAAAQIPAAIVQQAIQAADFLLDFMPPPKFELLTVFAEKFSDRYGDRLIPMLELFNPETGIAFDDIPEPHDWFKDIALRPVGQLGTSSAGRRDIEDAILALLGRQLAEVDLQSLEHLATVREDIPKTCSILMNPAVGGGDGSRKSVLVGMTQAGAGNLVARFAAKSPELASLYRKSQIIEDGLFPHAVVAEVIHVPDPRLWNVVTRPAQYRYQLVLSGAGSADGSLISVTDLYVGCVDGRIFVWSKRLGKEIIPALGSAHNHQKLGNLNIYKFLCMLRLQNERVLSFEWSAAALKGRHHLPRVTYGNIVIAAERRKINRVAIKRLKELVKQSAFDEAREYLEGLGLSRFFSLDTGGDQPFDVDAHSPSSLLAMIGIVKHLDGIWATESNVDLDCAVLGSGDGQSYAAEVLIPVHQQLDDRSSTRPSVSYPIEYPELLSDLNKDDASAWVFYKLYGDQAACVDWLTRQMSPLLSRLKNVGAIEEWHYVRYSDKGFHIRLRWKIADRLHSGTAEAHERIADALNRCIFDRVERSRYVPEYLRYGGKKSLGFAEKVFWIDSDFCASCLPDLNQESEELPLIYARAAIQVLSNLNFTTAEMATFAREVRMQWGAEYQLVGSGFERLRQKYEALAERLERVAFGEDALSPSYEAAFECRSVRLRAAIADYKAEGGQLTMPRLALESLFHMLANRLFVLPSRQKEFVVWDLLSRTAQRRLHVRSR